MFNSNQKASIAKSSTNSATDSLRNKLPITNYNDEKVVNARDLHQRLQVTSRFNDWINNRIKEYGFLSDSDYYLNFSNVENQAVTRKDGKNKRKEYFVTVEMAKELAMVERNEIGRQIRRALIEIEKRYRTEVMQPALYGIFKGLTGVMYMGHRCYPYTGVLRNIGYSTKSGAVQERKKKFKGQFFKLFGRNFITAELAEHLKESFMIRLNQRNLQMQLPFEAKGGQNG